MNAGEFDAMALLDEKLAEVRTEQLDRYRGRLVDGGAFIHDQPDQVPAIWGIGDEVLWSAGEPLMITGPTGVGKTTLAAQIVAGRIGLLDNVLGYPVALTSSRVLYLAMDRPAQIARALGRLLRAYPRDLLDERLVFWPGPSVSDVVREPGVLLEHARAAGADTILVDSLKDLAPKLSDDDVGFAVNRAHQLCVRDGVEVATLHHNRKAGAGGQGKPNTLSDVYGSMHLTAGMGSVVGLWGAAGDPVVELSHLKQPAAEVGPLKVEHDHGAGRSSVSQGFDFLDALRFSPRTPTELAQRAHGTDKPTDAQVAKARRKVERLVRDGLAIKVDGPSKGGATASGKGGATGARYAAADPCTTVGSTDGSTDGTFSDLIDRRPDDRPTPDTFPQVNRPTDRPTRPTPPSNDAPSPL